MGCNQSTVTEKAGGRRQSAVPMSKDEIGKRIESIDATKSATFGGVTVRYAYLSQRGYYPDGGFGYFVVALLYLERYLRAQQNELFPISLNLTISRR